VRVERLERRQGEQEQGQRGGERERHQRRVANREADQSSRYAESCKHDAVVERVAVTQWMKLIASK
jgi:hypothetical protein